MDEVLRIYSPDEINAMLRLIAEFLTLLFATSVGVFTREMIYPNENTVRESIGLLLLASVIAFGINIVAEGTMTIAYTFLVCIGSGFFVPAFKDWLKGKNLFRLIINIIKNVKSVSDSVLDELNNELDKEIDKEKGEDDK